MVNLENYVSKAIRDKMKYKSSEELINNTKGIYLRQISTMHSGASIIENLTGHYNIPFGEDDTDWEADLSQKLTLEEIYYHYAHILTCKRNTFLFKFEKNHELIKKYKENIKAVVS